MISHPSRAARMTKKDLLAEYEKAYENYLKVAGRLNNAYTNVNLSSRPLADVQSQMDESLRIIDKLRAFMIGINVVFKGPEIDEMHLEIARLTAGCKKLKSSAEGTLSYLTKKEN